MKKYSAFVSHINFFFALLALGTCLITGCGESLPPTINVHGKIIYQGKPLDNGMVTFEPVNNGENPPLRPAKGYTDSQGAYRLSTFRTNDGAMPGNYKVLIHSLGDPGMEASKPGTPLPASEIPQKYAQSDTSDLAVIIDADGPSEVEFNFDLVP